VEKFTIRINSDTSTGHFTRDLSAFVLVTAVAGQLCKGNPLLRFRGNTPPFYIVDSCMSVDKNTKNTLLLFRNNNVASYYVVCRVMRSTEICSVHVIVLFICCFLYLQDKYSLT
jgi:hypothetical protein